MFHKRALLVSACAVPLLCSVLAADEPRPSGTAAAAAPAVSTELVERWIRELDSDNFDIRMAAARKLSEAGKAAIEPVCRAADNDNLEVTTRAMEVLGKLFKSEDKATSEAAREALEKLAKSDRKSVARRAEKVLRPEIVPNQANDGVIVGNGIQIQLAPAIQGARIQVQAANGERSIEVDDNGRKVKIKENKEGIEIEVSGADANGKAEVKTYKAKDAEELKKQHPEAHKLYEKYGGGRGNAGIVIGNVQVQAQALPAGALPINPRRLLPKSDEEKKALERINQVQKQLDEMRQELKKLGEDHGIEEIEKIVDRISRITQEIEKARGALDTPEPATN